MTVFRFSNIYLSLLFAAVAIDTLTAEPADPSSVLAWIGATLVVGGTTAIVIATRPRSWREFALVLVPAVGAVIMAAVVLTQI
jgi:hypothetical protein